MTKDELNLFLDARPYILWAEDEAGNFYFRHEKYDAEEEKVKVELSALAELTPEKLEKILVAGRDVEHITRITGYFSRVSGWNKGKKGELADRYKATV